MALLSPAEVVAISSSFWRKNMAERRKTIPPLSAAEEEYLASLQVPPADKIPARLKDVDRPQQRGSQSDQLFVRGAKKVEDDKRDPRFSRWQVPRQGIVLVFDPHGLRLHELAAYYAMLDATQTITYIIHGGDGSNPIAKALRTHFGNRLSAVAGQLGVSKLRPQR